MHVVQERRRRGEHLDVAGPPEPFVALRAVGGHVEEVAPQTPDHVLVQPVDERVRAGEPAGPLHVGVDHLGGDGGGVEGTRPAVDLGVPEAVEGELRLPGDRTVPGQGEGVGRLGQPERSGAELVVLQHLGVPQGDHGAGRAVDGQSQPAHQVLAEVQHRPSGRGGDHLLDGQLLDPADDRRGPRARGGDRFGGDGRGPVGVVESRAVPARLREPRVVVLAVVDPAGRDRPRADPPGLVGDHHLAAAVRVRDHQLTRHGGLVGVEGCGLAAEAVPLGGPAAGETDPERVGPGDQQVGHVGGLVDEPPLVRRPARLEDLVVDVGRR